MGTENSLFLVHNLDSCFLQKTKDTFTHYALFDFNDLLEKEDYAKAVLDFKKNINLELLDTLKVKFNSDLIIKDKEDLLKIIREKDIKNVIMPYLNCGYENDFISKIKEKVKISYLARSYDQYCYPFAMKGFFAFKEQIPKILNKFL